MITTLPKVLISKENAIKATGKFLAALVIFGSCFLFLCNPQKTKTLDLKWSSIIEGELTIEPQFIQKEKIGKVLLELVELSEESTVLSCLITFDDGNSRLLKDFDSSKTKFFQDSIKNASSLQFKRKSLVDGWQFAHLSINSHTNYNFLEGISQKFYPEQINLNFINSNSKNNFQQDKSQLSFKRIGTSNISNYIIPHYKSLDSWKSEFFKLQNDPNITLNFDSLLMIIKDSEDISYKCKGDSDELISNLENLSFSDKSASVYLMLTDQLGEKHYSIFTFGSQCFLNLENPALIERTFGVDISDLECVAYRYVPSSYFFSWGNIALSIKQDEKGNYNAKSSVPYSTWYDAISKVPNLTVNQGDSIVDEFSVQVKLEKGLDAFASGMNLGKFSSSDTPMNSFLGKKDTIENLKQNSIGSTLLLSDFVLFNEIKEHINLEISITEDKLLQPSKRFQFNWKNIDTVITKETEEADYELCIKMRKKAFLECLPFEPVLTSSEDGVIWDYSFDILKQEDSSQALLENVACSIKNPKLYNGTSFKEKFQNDIHTNDVVILRNFKASEIEENLTIYITIEEDLEEPEEFSKEIYVDWGKSKFKATDLSSDRTKKFYSEQIITKEKLLKITSEDIYLIRNGKKEIVDQADLIITNDMEVNSCKKDNAWNYCLDKLISQAKLGDHVNIFLRSNSGQSALMQFYIERADSEADILGYGIQSDFDSLLFKYAEPIYKKEKAKISNFQLYWGEDEGLPLKLMGNPNIYGGSVSISNQAFFNKLGNAFNVSSETNGNIQLTDVHLFIYSSKSGRPLMFPLDCYNGECSLSPETIERIFDETDGVINHARLIVNEHEKQDLDGKVKSFDFVIDNPEGPWIPKQRLERDINLKEQYDFQFVYNYNGKSILKLDLDNPDYKWMIDKYKTDPNVQIMNFANFKTVIRTIDEKYGIVKKEDLKHVEVLSEHFKSVHEYPDFNSFQNAQPELIWKSYLGTRSSETICLEDFVCSEGGLQLSIKNKPIKIFRGELLIINGNGKNIKYVFDDINDFEIEKRLKALEENTSLYFTNLLVESESGDIQRFPLSFAYHLE